MRDSELRGKPAHLSSVIWQGMIQQRVVNLGERFGEIRVLGNVWRGLKKFEPHRIPAPAAEREERVPQQKQ